MKRDKRGKNSGSLVDKDRKTGRFLPGHKKLGGRNKGAVNFSTKMIIYMDNMNIEDSIDPDVLVEQILKTALKVHSSKLLIYLWERLEGKPK